MKKLALLLVFVMMFATACAPVADAPADDGPKEVVQEEVKPAEPSVLRVGIAGMPANMDPGTGVSNDKHMMNFSVFDTLMFKDNYNDGALTSYIAESWKIVDDYTIRIKLKNGITFHNGEALTAEDVQYSIERIIKGDPEYISSTISTQFVNIESVTVVDELTVEIKSTIPDLILLDRFASVCGIYVIPKDYLEKVGNEEFGLKPMGSGPYKVVEYSPEKLVMEYYDVFYGERPTYDRIEFLVYPETATRVTALMTGEIDMCFNITTDNIAQIEGTEGLRVEATEVASFHLLCFNSSIAPMDDVNLRKALSLAVDRQTLADTLWGGYATVRNGYNFPEYGDYYVEDYPEYIYDVELAKEYLAKSDYAGETITYQLNSGYYTLGNEVAEAIVSMWNAIGVNAVIEYNTTWTYDTFHVHNWSNGPRFMDPAGGLWLLWGEGTRADRHYWPDDEFRAEFWAQAEILNTATDFKTRYEANKRMMEMWDEDSIGTVLFQISEFCGMDKNIAWERNPDYSISFRAEHLKVQ